MPVPVPVPGADVDVDVAIVGFGPVGAVAAALLGQAGLRVHVCDRLPDVYEMPVHTLDFGGVLVNEVPTWRADQQPYGGLRDSGNTREGPAFSVKEMTEIRMVVLSR